MNVVERNAIGAPIVDVRVKISSESARVATYVVHARCCPNDSIRHITERQPSSSID